MSLTLTRNKAIMEPRNDLFNQAVTNLCNNFRVDDNHANNLLPRKAP